MNLYHSAEGTYDEAVEASAEQIMFCSRDGSSSSSGYSSDTEASNAHDIEVSSIGSRTSSSLSALSSSATETSDPVDIESEISFLQEKQGLLQRAISAMKREDDYAASRARDIVEGKFERKTSALWVEAR